MEASMSGVRPDTAQCASRRDFLFTAAVGGVAIAGAGILASPALAAGKVSQKAVSYQPTPKGNQQCVNCANFQSPASCKLVDGTISPSGWCNLYSAKK
jgi:secreted PhoX family phosphatase